MPKIKRWFWSQEDVRTRKVASAPEDACIQDREVSREECGSSSSKGASAALIARFGGET